MYIQIDSDWTLNESILSEIQCIVHLENTHGLNLLIWYLEYQTSDQKSENIIRIEIKFPFAWYSYFFVLLLSVDDFIIIILKA